MMKILTLCMFLGATAHAGICDDPVREICGKKIGEKSIDTNILLSAERLVSVAARETQMLFKFSGAPEKKEFVTFLIQRMGKIKSYADKDSKDTLYASIFYGACLDFLSRQAVKTNHTGEFFYQESCVRADETAQQIGAILSRLVEVKKTSELSLIINKIKTSVTKVVARMNIPYFTAGVIKKAIEDTQLLAMTDYAVMTVSALKENRLTQTNAALGISKLFTTCDLTAQDLNAFNATILDKNKNPTHYLVACPALWAFATQSGMEIVPQKPLPRDADNTRVVRIFTRPTSKFELSFATPVLAHEVGHTIGTTLKYEMALSKKLSARVTPEAYVDNFVSCIYDHHVKAGQLFTTIAEQKINSPNVAQMFFDEYFADAVSAEYLAEEMRGKSVLENTETLKKSLKWFCAIDQHDRIRSLDYFPVLHPSGLFRIETDFMGNASLRATMGCSTNYSKKSCAI